MRYALLALLFLAAPVRAQMFVIQPPVNGFPITPSTVTTNFADIGIAPSTVGIREGYIDLPAIFNPGEKKGRIYFDSPSDEFRGSLDGSTFVKFSTGPHPASSGHGNGANCASGNSPLGVDENGAVESCFDVATQAELDVVSGSTEAFVQKSGDTMTGNLSFSNNAFIQLDAASSVPSHSEGVIYYDAEHNAVAYYNDNSGVRVLIGHTVIFEAKNESGGAITTGQVVYMSGAAGGVTKVKLAIANDHDKSHALGVVIADIANNQVGYVAAMGEVSGFDTNSFNAGDEVYLSNSVAGALTNVAPPQSGFVVHMGSVLKKDVSNGSIQLSVHIDHPVAENLLTKIRTSAQLQTESCTGYPTVRCQYYNSTDDDVYTSTGSLTGQWRNTRNGLGPQ